MNISARRARVRGISLIELLISLVIGLVVVGAVMVSIIGSGQTGRYQAAFAQMNEDAQIAFSILTRDIQMAGYSQPTGLVSTIPATPTPTMVFSFGTLGTSTHVIGCDTGFADPRAVPLTCGTATTPAFEVVYEADANNTVLTSTGRPSDCLGNRIGAVADPAPYVARNRYFLSVGNSARPELSCTSAGAATGPEPLVENIEDMRVLYGVAAAPGSTQVLRYVTATQVRAIGPNEWFNVISVRLCLLVRSSDPVLSGEDDSLKTYLDCDAVRQTSADRYVRRAFFTTAAIRDKMP